jgi:stringent starvation protein B
MSAHQAPEPTSTRPYLIRALHEWCSDNGFTPYVTVAVDATVQVPMEYVKDGEIVLNIGFDATTSLSIGNEYLEFKARFSGAVRDIMIPVDQIMAIFARENGQGMAFPKAHPAERQPPAEKAAPRPVVTLTQAKSPRKKNAGVNEGAQKPPVTGGTKPTLTRVK